jgi:hypothetical protein
VIGGISVFAIDSALTAPPHRAALAKAEPPANASNPIRTVGGSVPDPAVGMSAGPPAQAQPAPAQPQAPAQPTAPVQAQSAQPQPTAPAQAQPIAPTQQTASPAVAPVTLAPVTPTASVSQQAWPMLCLAGTKRARPMP